MSVPTGRVKLMRPRFIPNSGGASSATADTLSARILIEEHRAYPDAVQAVLDGGWRIEGRRFVRAAAKTLDV